MALIGNAYGNKSESEKPEFKESGNRFKGRIIKLHENGWGFITSQEIRFTRIFFHWSALRQNTLHYTQLKEGMEVEFNTVDVPDKGKRATKIVVTNTEVPEKKKTE